MVTMVNDSNPSFLWGGCYLKTYILSFPKWQDTCHFNFAPKQSLIYLQEDTPDKSNENPQNLQKNIKKNDENYLKDGKIKDENYQKDGKKNDENMKI